VIPHLLLGLLLASGPLPWPHDAASVPLSVRIAAPDGYHRVPLEPGAFGAFLRDLPVRVGDPPVRLHDGTLKKRQDIHAAVLDLDTGPRDLQQCADAVIRLRAEYLWADGRRDGIRFRFTSGDEAAWPLWADGWRPRVDGAAVRWSRSAPPDASYASFRRYLDKVFEYAGTRSLVRELRPLRNGEAAVPGDVLLQGGSPGHAVLLVDAVGNAAGERLYLLAQSYLPAQDVHVLKNLLEPGLGPWFRVPSKGPVVTPEWTFGAGDLRRFPD
jgi:hypothetical protein